jgi:hypothetical protein
MELAKGPARRAASDEEPPEMNRSSPVSRRLASVAFVLTGATARAASAQPPPPVDVVLHEAPPPRRVVAIEWNPLALLVIGKVSANVVVVPTDHHALVLSPFYASTTTAPIYIFDASGGMTQLPQQTFSGFGGEIGYRYYLGEGGPRGFFIGPSLMLASITAKAGDGGKTEFLDYGLAADAGWGALVTDKVAISLGGGLQYTATSKSIPSQQLPAAVYANNGVRPRVLFSVGWAF